METKLIYIKTLKIKQTKNNLTLIGNMKTLKEKVMKFQTRSN